VKIYDSGPIKSNLYLLYLFVSSIEDRLDKVTYWKMKTEEAWKWYYTDGTILALMERYYT